MSDLTLSLVVAAVFASGLAGVLSAVLHTALGRRSKSDYDIEHHRAIISDMRESAERQIALLTDKLITTEERWKDVNHLLISSQEVVEKEYSSASGKRSFLGEMGIDADKIPVDENLIFVLTPFSDFEYKTYEQIRSVAQENGFRCVRGDESIATGEILQHIIRLMMTARIIIANVSSRNPNVFYELGVAHALNKEVILIAKSNSKIPFNIMSKRIVFYAGDRDLREKLTSALLRIIRRV